MGAQPMPLTPEGMPAIACFAGWQICDGGGGGQAEPGSDRRCGAEAGTGSASRGIRGALERAMGVLCSCGKDEGLTAVKISRLDLASRPRGAVERAEAGRSGGCADWAGGDDAGWQGVRILVPARYLHVVSGRTG